MTSGDDDAFDSLRGVAGSPVVSLPPRQHGPGEVLAS
jgi:hypothetical protein